MGKASKRRSTRSAGSRDPSGSKAAPAPFVVRPFEGLPGETEWVAMRELVPAATAQISLAPAAVPEGSPASVATIATVLPLAWPALHRNDGEVLVATQSGASSGDASRDLAAALLLALAADEGTPVVTVTRNGAAGAHPISQRGVFREDTQALTLEGDVQVEQAGGFHFVANSATPLPNPRSPTTQLHSLSSSRPSLSANSCGMCAPNFSIASIG